MDLTITPQNTYNLNQGQKDAAEAFLGFLFSNEKEFHISGPAGVGKTYLMNYIIDNTLPRYFEMCQLLGVKPEYNEVIMTATTHKAAEVLGLAVKRPTSTVHSFFNLVVRDNYTTGKSELHPNRQWRVHENKIIFIDEASMIDSSLWNALHEGTKNCKLVYVGDRHQLAPVNESLSPIYKHNAPMVELLEPVRNASQPALLEVCEQLRETVDTGIFKPIKIVPGVIDLLDNKQMPAEIHKYFAKQTHEARILTYKNEKVIQYNNFVRQQVRGFPDQLQVGELLINNTMLHHTRGQTPIETELKVLKNSGPSSILIDDKHDVHLHVNKLSLEDSFGNVLLDIPFATDRQHLVSLIKYYGKVKEWDKYFYLKNKIADLRPRDAATVHKAQGSTYDTVFIDTGDISTCNIPSMVARMLYVAFSRARTRVVLYGNLAAKYGGFIQ